MCEQTSNIRYRPNGITLNVLNFLKGRPEHASLSPYNLSSQNSIVSFATGRFRLRKLFGFSSFSLVGL
jgi:hypothetical protein